MISLTLRNGYQKIKLRESLENHFRITNNSEYLAKCHIKADLIGKQKLHEQSLKNLQHTGRNSSLNYVKWNKVVNSEDLSQPLEEGIPRVEPTEVTNTLFVVILEDKYEQRSDKIRFGLFKRPRPQDKGQRFDLFLISVRDAFHLNDKFRYMFTRYGKPVEGLDQIKGYDRVLILCRFGKILLII